jgi:hypothetical protein
VVGLGLFKLSWWDDSAKVLGPADNVPIETDMEKMEDDL